MGIHGARGAAFLAAGAIVLSACAASGWTEADAIGTWQSAESGEFEFREDGTFSASEVPIGASGPNCTVLPADRSTFEGTYTVIDSGFIYLDGWQVWFDSGLFGPPRLRVFPCGPDDPHSEVFTRT